MEPTSDVPALSKSFGNLAKTDGVYPFCAGGSPMASPISLCAIANLVTESIIRITFLPLSLKYSAMAVAVNAPLTLSKADLSEVAQTTTDFFIPSGPKSFSINSRTSRPLSPIRHITLTSASASLAIIPNVVLLPTPEPAKIPILCPSPQVKKPSMALTPVGSISFILFLFNGSGG